MLALFGTIQASALGTKDGGGGNLCYLGNKPVLLEFADLNHELNEPGVQFERTEMMDELGFSSPEYLLRGELKERVKAILKANEVYSPTVVSLFRNLVQKMNFSFTNVDIRVPVKADVSQQPNCQHGNVKASVVYLPSHVVFADLKKVNAMDLDSQAGLVLHESARYIQTFQANTTDLDLQNMIRTMFDVYKGRSRESLDTDKFYSSLSHNVDVFIESTDLCMEGFYSKKAVEKVFRRNFLVLRSDLMIENPNIAYEPTEIQDQVQAQIEHDTHSAPQVMKDACELATKTLPWNQMKAKLQDIQRRVNYLDLKQEDTETMELFKSRLATAIANPSHRIIWKSAAIDFVIKQAETMSRKREASDRLFDKLEEQVEFNPRMACNSKANLEQWLRLGAGNLKQYEDGKVLPALFAPNAKCTK
jgi:hypothetical protein